MSSSAPSHAPDQHTPPSAQDALVDYGTSATKLEPGGIERIPDEERHGRPWHLFATWMSPNLEFATVYVGVLGVGVFGLSFWQTFAAIVLGTGLGALTQATLSSWGPEHGLAQMVLSRTAFGKVGNILPAGLNAIMAGFGWFAVNSVSGAYALATLFSIDPKIALAIVIVAQIVIACFGHNLIHVFERVALPFLSVIFLLAAISTFAHADIMAPAQGVSFVPPIGAFLIVLGATFGYACGWNPYASDYTRYLKPGQGRSAGLAAGLGVFVSCVILETVGAASATIINSGLGEDASPTDAFTHSMPGLIAAITLAGISIGAISANVLNIYSGAMAFLAVGIKIPSQWQRGIVALLFGVVGGAVAYWALPHPDTYEGFLLVIAYWIGPWLAIVLIDRYLRRGESRSALTAIAERPTATGWPALVSMLVAMVIAIVFFSNQTGYEGIVPKANPAFGDLAFEVGFLVAGALYLVLRRLEPARTSIESGGRVR